MTKSKKKKVGKKVAKKEKKFPTEIRNFKKVENDHNYAHYQQHFCLDYDQIDNCHCDSIKNVLI